MSQAIIYTRFSPRKNADQSESCETQEALCREYAAKEGWEVKAVYADEGISGKTSDRPGLARALADLHRGDVLLVYKRDRLARDVLIAELTRRQVAGAGATIAAVSGDIAGDDSDPTVIFVRQIMDAVAELERKQIAIRTRDAMLQHQQNGRKMSRFSPYGWRIDPDDPTRLLESPVEQSAIALVRKLAGEGLGVSAIKNHLAEHQPQWARSGKWSYNAVKRIMTREGLLAK